jgi:hypothetical protein
MKNGTAVVKHNQLILNDFIAVSLRHENPFVREKIREKEHPGVRYLHEAESRVFSFMDSHPF